MEKILKDDSSFSKITSMLFDLVVLNVLWLLLCLPVITIGASTAALFNVTLKMAEGKNDRVVKDFLHSFAQNFKQSIVITLIMLGVATVLMADIYILRQMSGQISAVFYGMIVAIALVAIALGSYTIALFAKFDNSCLNLIQNASRLALLNIPKTIVITAWNALPIILLFLAPSILAKLLFLFILIGGSGLALLESYLYVGMFKELIEKE